MSDRRLYIALFFFATGAMAQNYNYGNQANSGNNYNSGGNNYGGGNNYSENQYSNQYNQASGNNYEENSYGEGNAAGNNSYGENSYGGNSYGNNSYGGNEAGNNYGGNYSVPNVTNNYGSGSNYTTPAANGTNAYGTNTYSAPAVNAYGSANAVVPAAETTDNLAPPVQEQLPPGPPAERDFQFQRFGAPGIHIYKLKWPDSNRNLQTIEVYKNDTGDLLQNIAVPQDGLRLVYSELSEPTARYQNNMREQIIDAVDYNFDNYVDIRLTKSWPYGVGSRSFYIWLYDPETDQYKLHNELSALAQPYPDVKNKRIESVTLQGWGGAEFIKNVYTIDGDGKLRVDTRITNTIYDRQKLWFVRDIRSRVNGELQRVCKLLMRSEGMPKRMWGSRSACTPYLVKGPPSRKGR